MRLPLFRSLISAFVLFSLTHSIGQELIGSVTDVFGQPIEKATVVVKTDSLSNLIIAYATTNASGYYSIEFESPPAAILVEAKSLGYKTKTGYVSGFNEKTYPYRLDLTMEQAITPLTEVFVQSEKKAIRVKKDTIVYDPEAFKDGSERVVEDILEKLPGVKVDQSGKITFKGQPIETVLLDGDDLFSENYTIGTKNIDVDLIDKIAAIENYIKNPLLKGIKNSQDVAINLSLKAGEADYSNDTELGAGIENRVKIKSNTLSVGKRFKAFMTASFNNVGEEYSPYDYFSLNSLSLDDTEQRSTTISGIIPQADLATVLEAERARRNQNLFGSLNAIFKASERLGVKVNLDYKRDRLDRSTNTNTDFFTATEGQDISEVNDLTKTPEIINSNLDLSYKLADNQLITSRTIITKSDVQESSQIVLNNAEQASDLDQENLGFLQKLDYTNRINDNLALIGKVEFGSGDFAENLMISPDLRFESEGTVAPSLQTVDQDNTLINVSGGLLFGGDNLDMTFDIGYDRFSNRLSSSFTNQNFTAGEPLLGNDLEHTNSAPWLRGAAILKSHKWRIAPVLKLMWLDQTLEAMSNRLSDSKLLVLPELNINYGINDKSFLRLKALYGETPLRTRELFSNAIITSNRNAISNTPTLETRREYAASLRYSYNDFYNLVQLYSSVSYGNTNNNFLSDLIIQDSFVVLNRTLFDNTLYNISANAGLDMYVSFLRSNFRFNTTFSSNTYQNIVNDSELRDNTTNNLFVEANIKTGFLGMVNFQNNVQLLSSTFNSNNAEASSFGSFQNSFKFILKPNNQLQFILGYDYYKPNLDLSDDFSFFDLEVRYTSKNDKFEYSLISKNITPNSNVFSQTFISDFSSTITFYNLVNAYALLSFKFRL